MPEIIDCDAHILEPADLWQNYLESRYKSRAIRVEVHDGVEKLIIGEKVVLEGVVAGLGGAEADKAKLFGGQLSYIKDNPLDTFDPYARAKRMDEWGIAKAIVFPTIGILPFPTNDQDLANAYCRAYNNWMADFCSAVPGRFFAIALVNWFDVEAAAAELQRCLDLGFKGLFVPPETISGKRPADACFDPLWSICQEANIPGCFHVIVRFEGAARPFADWQATTPGPLFGFGLGATGQLLPAIASTVTDRLFDRFPRLKIISVEAGCGYAPYLMDRLDAKYEAFRDLVPLAKRPSEYIRSNVFFVAEQGERTIDAALALVGDDRILWGSDYPHVDALTVHEHLPSQWPQLARNVYTAFPID
ncbi:MAG: amidohydrolase family protein [Pseudomonadales bacterium]